LIKEGTAPLKLNNRSDMHTQRGRFRNKNRFRGGNRFQKEALSDDLTDTFKVADSCYQAFIATRGFFDLDGK
jgi:hypothetical protein